MKALITAAVLAGAALAAHAQAWPTAKPVTLLVPFPPGGSTDMMARTLAHRLPAKLGGTYVVQNTAGAGGTLGAAAAKRAATDGYTVLVASLGPLVIGPHLMKNLPYDPLKDFDYVTVAVQAPNVLVVPAASPFKSVAQVLEQLRAQPGKLTFASAGNGTSDHLTAELFWQETRTTAVHIPYKGGAPAMQDVLGGQVDASFMNLNTVLPNLRAGKLRALAVTSTRRSAQLPEVPTMDELGLKGVTVQSWQAVVLPRGVAPEVRTRLHEAIVAVLAEPAVRQPLLDLGFEVVGNTPEAFTEFQAREFARWKQVIEVGKITAD